MGLPLDRDTVHRIAEFEYWNKLRIRFSAARQTAMVMRKRDSSTAQADAFARTNAEEVGLLGSE